MPESWQRQNRQIKAPDIARTDSIVSDMGQKKNSVQWNRPYKIDIARTYWALFRAQVVFLWTPAIGFLECTHVSFINGNFLDLGASSNSPVISG